MRLEWLSTVRGLCILLVVMFHVQLVDMSTGENHEICRLLALPFNQIRIPLFIFTSGSLLYLSRISKNWSVGRLYVDKFQRIVIPFLFFVVVYYGIKWLMHPFVKTPVVLSWSDFLQSFYLFEGHASAPLWFLATLSVLMLLYPMFRVVLRSHVASLLFLIFSVVIYFIDFWSLLPENYFYILKLNHYLVFFYSGILFFRYRCYDYTGRWWVLLSAVALYALLFYFEVPVAVSLVGIVMLFSLSQLVCEHVSGLFSSFRDYIYQIYLMSFFFQGIVELLLWRRLCYSENLFWAFYLLNILFGLYGPVIVLKLVERCPLRIVKMMFGLKA